MVENEAVVRVLLNQALTNLDTVCEIAPVNCDTRFYEKLRKAVTSTVDAINELDKEKYGDPQEEAV